MIKLLNESERGSDPSFIDHAQTPPTIYLMLIEAQLLNHKKSGPSFLQLGFSVIHRLD